MSSPRSPKEERELEDTLRLVAAMVLLALFSLIVFAVLFLPQRAETTLMLGLFASILGAVLPLLGVSLPFRSNKD